MNLSQHGPRSLFPQQTQRFDPHLFVSGRFLDAVELGNHRQHRAHARTFAFHCLMEVTPGVRPTPNVHQSPLRVSEKAS